ncbi:hypothetical protein D3C71_866180 [compost metagenome]
MLGNHRSNNQDRKNANAYPNDHCSELHRADQHQHRIGDQQNKINNNRYHPVGKNLPDIDVRIGPEQQFSAGS